MAATLAFLAGQNTVADISNMALGFYGPNNFGTTIRVSQWADNTYVSDPSGTTQGAKACNVKYIDSQTGQLGTGDTHNLRDIPNSLATLNVRFTNDTACLAQNVTATFYDRSNPANPPVGCTMKMAEIVHPSTTMNPSSPTGTGSASWAMPGGAGGTINGRVYDAPLSLTNSPGPNSANAGGAAVASTTHDWFLALAASPDSIGSKTYVGVYISLEYL